MARVIASGFEALRRSREVLPGLFPVTGRTEIGQTYHIPVCTIDKTNGDIILGQSGWGVLVLHRSDLLEMSTGEFLQGYQLGQIASEVLDRTRWIIPASQITMAFVMGMAAGAFAGITLAGVGVATLAAVAVFATKVTFFYLNHRRACDRAIAGLATVVEVVGWIKDHCPTTYDYLCRLLRGSAWAAVLSIPEGVTGADGAAVLGRLLGGLSAAPEAGLGPLLRVLGQCATTFATRLPAMAGRGVQARATASAESFLRILRDSGVPVTERDAQRMILEFQEHPDVQQKLVELKTALDAVAPVLEDLAQAFRGENVAGPSPSSTP